MTAAFTAAQLDDLERPKRRQRIRVGSAKDARPGFTEHDIQAEIVGALRKLGFRVTASLNGVPLPGDRMRRARMVAHLKRIGMETGQFDLSLRRPKSRGGPAYGEIEIKRPGEALTTEQEERAARLQADGFAHGWACSVDSAVQVLRDWGWM